MKRSHLLCIPGLVAALMLTFVPVIRGEDSPPPPAADKTAPPPATLPAPPAATLAPAAAEAQAPSAAVSSVATAAATKPVEAPAKTVDATPAPPAAQPAQPAATLAPAASETPAPSTAVSSSAPAAAAKPVETAAAKPVEAPAKTVDATPAPSAGLEASAESSSSSLRRLDAESENNAGDNRTKLRDAIRKSVRKHVRVRDAGENGNERVAVFEDASVGKDEKVNQAVAVFGDTTVDGRVDDQAVAVFGDTTINGSVGDQAVSVFGDTTINGAVGGQAVAVGGDMEVKGHVGGGLVVVGGDAHLGPGAEVNGEVVLVGGSLNKNPTAVIHGQVQRLHIPPIGWLFAWLRSALFKARLLSFDPAASWAWLVAGGFLACYVFLALLFRSGVEKCAETFEQRPGFTILTAVLMMLAMPLVITLLAITGIGVLIIPFLAMGLFVAKLFGRAAMLAWFGRRVTGLFGPGPWSHIAVSVLIGGIIVALLYTVPVLAFIVSMLIGTLGLGAVVYTLVLSMRRNGSKPAPAGAPTVPSANGVPLPVSPVAPVAPAAFGTSAALGAAAGPAIAMASATPPPVISAMTLPRAGFWIRSAALLIDCVLWAIVLKLIPLAHFNTGGFLVILATYGAVMWKLRGTTVGGSICHLKVVRLDDRPLDWTVAIVRALSCFLFVGLLWVAFDDEKQSWHDKIAGTTVVTVPKGVALI